MPDNSTNKRNDIGFIVSDHLLDLTSNDAYVAVDLNDKFYKTSLFKHVVDTEFRELDLAIAATDELQRLRDENAKLLIDKDEFDRAIRERNEAVKIDSLIPQDGTIIRNAEALLTVIDKPEATLTTNLVQAQLSNPEIIPYYTTYFIQGNEKRLIPNLGALQIMLAQRNLTLDDIVPIEEEQFDIFPTGLPMQPREISDDTDIQNAITNNLWIHPDVPLEQMFGVTKSDLILKYMFRKTIEGGFVPKTMFRLSQDGASLVDKVLQTDYITLRNRVFESRFDTVAALQGNFSTNLLLTAPEVYVYFKIIWQPANNQRDPNADTIAKLNALSDITDANGTVIGDPRYRQATKAYGLELERLKLEALNNVRKKQ